MIYREKLKVVKGQQNEEKIYTVNFIFYSDRTCNRRIKALNFKQR